MALSDISLTSGMRGSLLSMQGNAKSIDRTQERLSTGRKVNSALDNPTNFFASQAALNRANDLNSRKDSVKEAIQNINAANNGITAISSLLSAANGLAEAALGTSDQTSRDSFSNQFDEILNQIDTLAADSGYRGNNLLKSDSLTVNFAEASGASSLSIAGVDATSTGLGVDKANGVSTITTTTGGDITDTYTIPAAGDIFGVSFGYYYLGTGHDAAGITSVSYNGTTLTTGWNPGEYVKWGASGGIVIGDNATTPINPGDSIVVTYNPGTGPQTNFAPAALAYIAGSWASSTSPVNTTTTTSITNLWATTSGIQTSLDQLATATTTMRSNAKSLASNSTILTTRLDFTSSLTNILQTGSDNLTLADMNEEGANMLMLQTRQSLGTTSLSMGAQAAQSVMRLF